MTLTTESNLPSLTWCPWHKKVVRSCDHRDRGLLKIDLSEYSTAHLLTPYMYNKVVDFMKKEGIVK